MDAPPFALFGAPRPCRQCGAVRLVALRIVGGGAWSAVFCRDCRPDAKQTPPGLGELTCFVCEARATRLADVAIRNDAVDLDVELAVCSGACSERLLDGRPDGRGAARRLAPPAAAPPE